jgi:hypothetical protein
VDRASSARSLGRNRVAHRKTRHQRWIDWGDQNFAPFAALVSIQSIAPRRDRPNPFANLMSHVGIRFQEGACVSLPCRLLLSVSQPRPSGTGVRKPGQYRDESESLGRLDESFSGHHLPPSWCKKIGKPARRLQLIPRGEIQLCNFSSL